MTNNFNFNENQQAIIGNILKMATAKVQKDLNGTETEQEAREKVENALQYYVVGMLGDAMKIQELANTEHFKRKIFQMICR